MQTSINGINLIKKFEGFSSKIYFCPAGLKTIGYGHVIRKNEDFSEELSQQKAEKLLILDLIQFEQAIKRLIKTSLNQYQFDALASFTFNLGAASLQRSTLRRKINYNYLSENEIAPEFMKWVYVKGSKSNGLIKRRGAELEMFFCNS